MSTESKKTGYSPTELQGTYMAMIDVVLPQAFRDALKREVKETDWNQDCDVNKGETFETQSHVTVHMKLPLPPSDDLVRKCRALGPFHISLEGLSAFCNVDKKFADTGDKLHNYDVLIVNVKLEDDSVTGEKSETKASSLLEFHRLLSREYKVEWQHPSFHPHVTLAYLKGGSSQYYIQKLQETKMFPVVGIPVSEIQFRKFRDRESKPIIVSL